MDGSTFIGKLHKDMQVAFSARDARGGDGGGGYSSGETYWCAEPTYLYCCLVLLLPSMPLLPYYYSHTYLWCGQATGEARPRCMLEQIAKTIFEFHTKRVEFQYSSSINH